MCTKIHKKGGLRDGGKGGNDQGGNRQWVSEGVIGVATYTWRMWEFPRKGLDRVQTGWTEYCISHYLAKLIGFQLNS